MKKQFCILAAVSLLTALQVQSAPVFETATTAIGESAAVTINMPANTQAGDLLVATLMLVGGTKIDVSSPPGWTLIHRNNKQRYIGMGSYYRIASGSDPASYSFGLDEKTRWAASISRISGADIENPIDAVGGKRKRSGNVIAPSITTGQNDTLVLAFYANRHAATYTPDTSTTEQFDQPNVLAGLPSNMLATFEQAQAGATGNKTAQPSLSKKGWVAQQISIAPASSSPPPIDLSEFTVFSADTASIGDPLVLHFSDSRDADGNPLNGPATVTVVSSIDKLIFNNEVHFSSGSADLSITLSSLAEHGLTLAVRGIQPVHLLSVSLRPRPVTLTADPGQSKAESDPDPELTFSVTSGTLLADAPLAGILARDSGESPGLYTLRQGSLTDENNSSYTITFIPSDFEIVAPEPPGPNVSLIEKGLWVSPENIVDLPMVGNPWRKMKMDADADWGPSNLSDQEDRGNVYAMAKAIVYVRTGIESYRTEVIDACMQAIGTEDGGRSLALSRNLGAFCIAADLVNLPPEKDAVFRSWLREVLTETMSEGLSLTECHENRPNNWGCHAGGSRAAAVAYLKDWEELDRIAQIFKGWLGDRNSYAGFAYKYSLAWQADPAKPVGINPVGATIQGHNVDGVLPDDQRKSGDFEWPPPKENYVYEAMQGALLQAVILHRAGYDVWNWGDKALLRAFTWLHETCDYPATGDDLWQPFIINYYYGTDFPMPIDSRYGKNVCRTCWTHQNPPQ